MSMSASDVLQLIKDREVKFVDFRFTDTRGKEQHVGVPVKCMGKEKFEDGTRLMVLQLRAGRAYRLPICC
jgi:L-glutamine synthetase (EC 6.3.1.2)